MLSHFFLCIFRCHHVLHANHGDSWRQKLKPLKVNFTEVPIVFGLDGQPVSGVASVPSPVSSQSQQGAPATSQPETSSQTSANQSEISSQKASQSEKVKTEPVVEKIQEKKVEKKKIEEKLSPQQKFEKCKMDGNEAVKKVHCIE